VCRASAADAVGPLIEPALQKPKQSGWIDVDWLAYLKHNEGHVAWHSVGWLLAIYLVF
jgi:hypothetical protein